MTFVWLLVFWIAFFALSPPLALMAFALIMLIGRASPEGIASEEAADDAVAFPG